MELALFVLSLACVALVVLLLARRGDGAAAQAAERLGRGLEHLQSEVGRLGRSQDELRQEVQRSREASLLQLADAAQGIRGDLGAAHRALAEVKAIEQGRARQMEQATDSLRRLEAVVAGSPSRGAAGENILARALAQLPPDLLAVNVAFGSRIVEYALRLPGGRLLPIDSKWTSVGVLERLDEDQPVAERKKLVEQLLRDVRLRIRDMGKYLDPERTLSLGLLAVPDAVYAAAPEAHVEGYREGVLVVPYSLALAYLLTMYRLALRFGSSVDADQVSARLRALAEMLQRAGEEVESRLSRALVQLQNSRDALRDHLGEASRATDRLLRVAETDPQGLLPMEAEAIAATTN